MSLRSFHIFFIAIATLFSAWFGYWSLVVSSRTSPLLGVTSIIAAIALVVYGKWFLKRAEG